MYRMEIDLSWADCWLVRSRSANLHFTSRLRIFGPRSKQWRDGGWRLVSEPINGDIPDILLLLFFSSSFMQQQQRRHHLSNGICHHRLTSTASKHLHITDISALCSHTSALCYIGVYIRHSSRTNVQLMPRARKTKSQLIPYKLHWTTHTTFR